MANEENTKEKTLTCVACGEKEFTQSLSVKMVEDEKGVRLDFQIVGFGCTSCGEYTPMAKIVESIKEMHNAKENNG